MRNALFVKKRVVQVALIMLLLAVAAVMFTSAQDHAWATSGTVTYNTLRESGAVSETRNTLRVSSAVSETYNTLRVYGAPDWPAQPGEPSGNMGAGHGSVTDEITGLLVEDQPYTDTIAIFNPQLPQAPRKDSITWNPLYMSMTETPDENQVKGLYNLHAAIAGDVAEKVWFRMWYEPEHWDTDDNTNGKFDRDPITGEPTDDDEWYPAIMQEFTYLIMGLGSNKPVWVPAGSPIVFPVGMREEDLFDPYGYGLTSLDVNFDGTPDKVYVDSEETFQDRTGLADPDADFDGDGIENLDPDGVPLSGDELVVLRSASFPISTTQRVQFLDHMARLDSVQHAGAVFTIWKTGDTEPSSYEEFVGTEDIFVEDGWFLYLGVVDPHDKIAHVIVGHALGATHSSMGSASSFLKRFYVDGHEYNVVAIKTHDDNFKFITIRTPIPKAPVYLPEPSVALQDYSEEDPLSVMPPYNFEHYILTDVQAITAFDTWEDDVAYLGEVVGPVAPILQKNGPFPYEGAYPDYPGDYSVGPYDDPREVYLRYVDEGPNPQLLGELKEKYGERAIEGGLVEAESDDVTKTGDFQIDRPDQPEASGGEHRYSNVQGDYVSYEFAGSSISLIYTTYTNRGIANIYIDEMPDGTPYTTLDMYAPDGPNFMVETLIASGLGAGSHTIVVEVSGDANPSATDTYVVVDAFRVGGMEEEFWYVEQWWTRPWEYTEFVLPDIQGETDLYLLTSAFTAPQSEYLYWVQDNSAPLRYNLAWEDFEWKHVLTDTISITPTLDGWKPRVKFWFDPAVGGRKYKGEGALRVYGFQNSGAGVDFVADPGDASYPVEVLPYTDPWAPFNPQLSQAPGKDSLTFNPAYMSQEHNGGEPLEELYDDIRTEDRDAQEKVFLRVWYEPQYLDKIRYGEVHTPTRQITVSIEPTPPDTFPAVMQEFTYMYLDRYGQPSHGQPGERQPASRCWFAFPMGTASDELPAPDPSTGDMPFMGPDDPARFGHGLTTFDADFDGEPDPVAIHSERTLSNTTGFPADGILGVQADFNGNGEIDPLERDGDELSGDELVIFAIETIHLERYESAMFLDYMVTLENVSWSPGSMTSYAWLKFWHTGGGLSTPSYPIYPQLVGDVNTLEKGAMVLVRKGYTPKTLRPGENNKGEVDGAWFAYVKDMSYVDNTVTLVIGRALGATHSAIDDGNGYHDVAAGDPWYLKRFFVDGHEYNVVAIKTVPADSAGEAFEFKYITIRTPVPKGSTFENQQDSIALQGYHQGTVFGVDTDVISVMPPFNYRHTRMNDIQRLEETAVPDGGTEEEIVFANEKFYHDGCMPDSIEGDVDPLQIRIVDEDEEEQFFGELMEKYWEEGTAEKWSTEQFHILPDQYTDLELPAGQLYLLTSNWESDQSWVHYYGCDPADGYLSHLQLSDLHTDILTPTEVITFTLGPPTVITNTYRAGPLRVKFWYDPDDPGDLYVGTWETTPTCVATADSNSPVCEGDTIELYGGPAGMDSYSWTGPGFSSSEISPTIGGATLAMSGTYTLTITIGSCTDTVTTDVTVNEKPAATASSNSPVAEGETLQLYGEPPGMASYSWTGPNGFNSSEISPTVSISATTDMAGTYTLTVTNTHGCIDSDTTDVIVGTDENQGYLVPQHSNVVTHCNTTEVGIWVNEADFKSGQMKLTYDDTCANVTDWGANLDDFTEITWDSSSPGQEWITFRAGDPLTGTYRVVTFTIHCASMEPCTTDLDFVEPTKLFDDWGSEIPGTWQDGSFGCGVGMCGDVAPYPGCNGIVDMGDVSLLHSYVGHPGDFSLCCEWCGDVAPYPDCNSVIDMGDVSLLHSYVGHPGDFDLCCEAGGGGAPTVPPVVSVSADNEVYLVPQESSAPFGETADVEIWVDATSFKSGQIKLAYESTCADVEGWEPNLDDFSEVTWDSDTSGEEWITFLAEDALTGTYRIGTLTIHGVYEEGCATILDFVEDGPWTSKLFDESGTEISATWMDGMFASPRHKIYLPLVMKNSQ